MASAVANVNVVAGVAAFSNVAAKASKAPVAASRSSFAGEKVQGVVIRTAPRQMAIHAVAEVKEAPKKFTPPALDPNTPSPIFGGSTGGLLRKAQVEEFYVITWEGKKEEIFEMPTGGAAIMRQGPNLLKLARKEQCLALGTQLRTKFKIDYRFYRVFPSGEVQYLHPKDGVYPEKVNAGRTQVGGNMRSIGANPNPAQVKFTGKLTIE
uniref:Photosystem I reaction center subunit II, chloroplastic n=1 Tax=Mesostigma viride TaxID=41882 RepID=A0A7S4X4Y3_MESVI|eukprot:jgi/Mesvir1/29495/Mv19745-RA.1